MRYSELELFGIRVSPEIIVFSMETPCWSPSEGLQLAWRQETSGNICSLLFLSQKVSSLCQTWKHSHRHFFQHIGYSELENIRRIDIFVHVTCYPETTPMTRIVKIPCSIFKTKRSTELKTGQQICAQKWLLPDEGENSKFLMLVFTDVTWKPRIDL